MDALPLVNLPVAMVFWGRQRGIIPVVYASVNQIIQI